MSVILVGNGESLLGSNMGKVIDSYDTVVRFDGLNIEGYEKDVGTKTDILVLDSFMFLRYMSDDDDDIRDGLQDIGEIWLMPNEKMYVDMAISFKNEFKNLKMIDKEYDKYRLELGYHKKYESDKDGLNYLSCEFYAVLHMIKEKMKFNHIGLDFLKVDLNSFAFENVFNENPLNKLYAPVDNSMQFYHKPNQIFKKYYSDEYWCFENMTSQVLELKFLKLFNELGILGDEVKM
jgi:hypothetical protein